MIQVGASICPLVCALSGAHFTDVALVGVALSFHSRPHSFQGFDLIEEDAFGLCMQDLLPYRNLLLTAILCG
eukprot:4416553-Amphidinium_carterae.1